MLNKYFSHEILWYHWCLHFITHKHHKFIALSLRAVSINAPLSMIEFFLTIHFTVILFFSHRWEISCLFIWTLFTFWRVFTFCSSLASPFHPNWMVVHKSEMKEKQQSCEFYIPWSYSLRCVLNCNVRCQLIKSVYKRGISEAIHDSTGSIQQFTFNLNFEVIIIQQIIV